MVPGEWWGGVVSWCGVGVVGWPGVRACGGGMDYVWCNNYSTV